MKHLATISSKGQVVIPKELRVLFDIDKHSRVVIEKVNNTISLRPAKPVFDKELESALRNFETDADFRTNWESSTAKRLKKW